MLAVASVVIVLEFRSTQLSCSSDIVAGSSPSYSASPLPPMWEPDPPMWLPEPPMWEPDPPMWEPDPPMWEPDPPMWLPDPPTPPLVAVPSTSWRCRAAATAASAGALIHFPLAGWSQPSCVYAARTACWVSSPQTPLFDDAVNSMSPTANSNRCRSLISRLALLSVIMAALPSRMPDPGHPWAASVTCVSGWWQAR